MNSLRLSLYGLLVCIFLGAPTHSGSPVPDKDTDPLSRSSGLMVEQNGYGLAAVHKGHGDRVCTGIHLNSYVVLAGSNCIKKYKDKKLYVYTLYKNPYPEDQAKVAKFECKNYYCLLEIEDEVNWLVGAFALPPMGLTTKKLRDKNHRLRTIEWTFANEAYQPVIEKITMPKTDRACGYKRLFPYWFCLVSPTRSRFRDEDWGVPVYYVQNKTKIFVGIYLGCEWTKPTPAHIFRMLSPSERKWVENILEKYNHEGSRGGEEVEE